MRIQLSHSCYVIGEERLATECIDILIKNGFKVLGLISSNKSLYTLAKQRDISCFENLTCLEQTEPYDYLFSIVNYQILSEKILKQPKIIAINYHDSLLPKYPGMHATSWAIFNKEKLHGITWHLMEAKVDAGDILKQKKFKIDSHETTFTLNLKCQEKAISSFIELIEDIKNNTLVRKKQSPCKRTYYSSIKKLPTDGLISWEQPSEDIVRVFRTLYFGEYTNRLGIVKFYFNNEMCTAKKIEELSYCSQTLPGTIVKVINDQIEISTKTNNVVLKDIRRLTCGNSPLTTYFPLKRNKKLKILDSQDSEKIVRNCIKIAGFEKFWVNELSNSVFVNLISSPTNIEIDKTNEALELVDTFSLRSIEFSNLSKNFEVDILDVFLSLFFIYMYRFTSQKKLTLAYGTEELCQYYIDSFGLFSSHVPFTIELSDDINFIETLKLVSNKRKDIIEKKSYVNDVFFRYPTLKNKEKTLPIAFFLGKEIAQDKLMHYSAINITYDLKNHCINLFISRSFNENLSKFIFKNIFSHIKKLIHSIKKAPTTFISQLDILTEQECKIIHHQNNITGYYLLEKTVVDLFEASVVDAPQKIAVEFENIEMSYKELNHKANQLAHFINKKYGTKRIVGLYFDRSIEMLVAIIGVLKANCAYVPISLEHPQERVEHILTDSKPILILTKTNFKPLLDKWVKKVVNSPEVLALDDNASSFDSYPCQNPEIHPRLDDVIYIIYTSGSTGMPKGVINIHLGLSNRILWMINQFNINKKDVFLQKTPYSFDISFWEMFTPLCSGAKLIIAKPEGHKDPGYLAETILEKSISIIHFVPSLLQVFLDLIKNPFHTLRIVVTSGEALSFNLKEQFLSQHPSAKLLNLYGPTEASIEVACWDCTRSSLNNIGRTVPIGRPINNVALYVLDQFMKPMPIGAKGELFIGGVAVAKGYLNNATLTKECFLDVPFGNALIEKLYKTGDIVRMLPAGEIEYLGRVDSQIKINGHRIELGDVENQITSFKNIKECVVLVIEQKHQRKNICACVTLKNKSIIDIKDLKAYLNLKLPSYMIPTKFLILDALPTNQNGKTDKHSLEKMFLSDQYGAINRPCTPIEEELLEIWSVSLGLAPDQLDVQASFFELGGESISAIKTAALISQKYNIDFQVSWIFEHSSIEKCAQLIIESAKTKRLAKISTNKKVIEMPNSQMRMIKPKMQIDSNNILTRLEWTNKVQQPALLKSVETLLTIYDILNFNLSWVQENPVFIYKKKALNEVIVEYNLSNKTPLERDKIITEICTHYLNLSINLEQDALFKIIIIKKTAEHYSLIIFFHHLIVDRDSINLVINSFFESYASHLDAPPYVTNKTLSPSFSEYMSNYFISPQELRRQENFWVEKLAHQPRLLKIHSENLDAGYQEAQLLSISFNEIRNYCVLHSITPFIFLLGLFKLLMQETFKSNQFAVGFILSKRNEVLYQTTAGPMANQSLILTKFSKNLTFISLLNHLLFSLREAYSNSDISLTNIEKILATKEGKKTALFSLFFDYEEEYTTYILPKGGIVSKTSLYSAKSMKRILSFRVIKRGDELFCGIRYRKALFKSTEIDELIKKYMHKINTELSK